MLRAFFTRLSLRERLLLAVFLWIGLFLWGFDQVKTFKRHRLDYHRTAVELEVQKNWLDRAQSITERIKTLLSQVDPAKTLDSAELSGRLDTLARAPNLNFDLTSPTTVESDIFNIHSVRLQIKRAKITDLLALDEALRKERPYIGMEGFQISANRNDPSLLEATYQVFSFELKRKNL